MLKRSNNKGIMEINLCVLFHVWMCSRKSTRTHLVSISGSAAFKIIFVCIKMYLRFPIGFPAAHADIIEAGADFFFLRNVKERNFERKN